MENYIQAIMAKGYTQEEATAQLASIKAQYTPENPAAKYFLNLSGKTPEQQLDGFIDGSIQTIADKVSGGIEIPKINTNSDVPDSPNIPAIGNGAKGGAAKKYYRPALSAAAETRLEELMNSNMEAKVRKTQNTRIEKLLFRAEEPSYVVKDRGGMAIISTKIEKMNEYGASLVDNAANRGAYDTLKTALVSKTPVTVYVPEKFSPRVIGVIVNVDGTENRVMDMADLNSFLLSEVTCVIIGSPSVELSRWVPKSSGDGANALSAQAVTMVLTWTGKAEAIEAQKYDFVMRQATEADKTNLHLKSLTENCSRLRTDMSFKVKATSAAGKEIERTKRLTCQVTDFPKYVVKDEYRGKFSRLNKVEGFRLMPDQTELKELMKRGLDGYAQMATGALDTSMFNMDHLTEDLNELKKLINTAPTGI